jgi:nitrogen fixation NifU-like protein
MSLDDLYREMIMEHYKNPLNRGELSPPSVSVKLSNPMCGDKITLDLLVADGKVTDVTWGGQGCSISQASASMMSEAVKGKSVDEALTLIAEFQGMMHGKEPADIGDLVAFKGVAKFPVRIKCALLPWEALQKGLSEKNREGR